MKHTIAMMLLFWGGVIMGVVEDSVIFASLRDSGGWVVWCGAAFAIVGAIILSRR